MVIFRDFVLVVVVTLGEGIIVVVIVLFSLMVDKTVSCWIVVT